MVQHPTTVDASSGRDPAILSRLAEHGRSTVALHRGSRADAVAATVEDLIVSEGLAEGTHLGTKAELASTFGVAPSTLNEAMQILASRERIRLRQGPRGGAFVAAPRPVLRLAHSLVQLTDGAQDVADALEVREALEPAVTLNALRNRRRDDLRTARRGLTAMERAEVGTELYRAVLDFHTALATACTNELMRLVYLGAVETVRTHTHNVIFDPGNGSTALHRRRLAVHRAILDAVEAQDEPALQRAMRRHGEYRSKQ